MKFHSRTERIIVVAVFFLTVIVLVYLWWHVSRMFRIDAPG